MTVNNSTRSTGKSKKYQLILFALPTSKLLNNIFIFHLCTQPYKD